MKRNKATIIWIVVIVVVLAGLFILPRITGDRGSVVGGWKDTGIGCLLQGHTRLTQHIHPALAITVDGTPEATLANIGIIPTCMSELHTHDGSGVIHAESADAKKTFTLGQFFEVWGEPLLREGYILSASVDGEVVTDPASIVLRDGELIALEYTRKEL